MEDQKLWKVLNYKDELVGYGFYCMGCECSHVFYTSIQENRSVWRFDGNMESPTFSPSLLNTYPNGDRCHLFLKGGKIQYLTDCYHNLKGQTIDMPLD